MLFPPGFENTGNICFASSVLQCLLNQQVFKEALDTIGVYHTPACQECQQGLFHEILFHIVCVLNKPSGNTRRAACTCIIAALHSLLEEYNYSARSKVLSSSNLLTSLTSKRKHVFFSISSNNIDYTCLYTCLYTCFRHKHISLPWSSAGCSGVSHLSLSDFAKQNAIWVAKWAHTMLCMYI